jgi:hypothetical protein
MQAAGAARATADGGVGVRAAAAQNVDDALSAHPRTALRPAPTARYQQPTRPHTAGRDRDDGFLPPPPATIRSAKSRMQAAKTRLEQHAKRGAWPYLSVPSWRERSSAGGEQQRVATPQAARPQCRHSSRNNLLLGVHRSNPNPTHCRRCGGAAAAATRRSTRVRTRTRTTVRRLHHHHLPRPLVSWLVR